MANIMLTYRCNLKCPYCFANEFVNHSSCDITMENFLEALKFLKTSGNKKIGLIGGEPTIHDHFAEILQLLADDEEIDSVTVYTNGIQMDICEKYLTNRKFKLLVNCNSPCDIGEQAYKRMCENLEHVFQLEDAWKRFNLGINLYQNDLDYKYIIELLEHFRLHRVRMSVTVPNMDEGKKTDSLAYLKSRKEYVLRFINDCSEHDIAPYFDCNVIPKCVWSKEDLHFLEGLIEKFNLKRTNLLGDHSFCQPVIDILPNLQAVRCFGTSDFTKVSIRDFRCFADLHNYFLNLVDRHMTSCMHGGECRSCYERKVLHCTAGCMAFARACLLKKIAESENS